MRLSLKVKPQQNGNAAFAGLRAQGRQGHIGHSPTACPRNAAPALAAGQQMAMPIAMPGWRELTPDWIGEE